MQVSINKDGFIKTDLFTKETANVSGSGILNKVVHILAAQGAAKVRVVKFGSLKIHA